MKGINKMLTRFNSFQNSDSRAGVLQYCMKTLIQTSFTIKTSITVILITSTNVKFNTFNEFRGSYKKEVFSTAPMYEEISI